jgi:hypothetical protein
VYRSDAAAAVSNPHPEGLPAVVTLSPGHQWQSVVPRSRAALPPSPSPLLRLPYRALTLGLGAAMLPLVVTAIVMIAPVRWLWGPSERR